MPLNPLAPVTDYQSMLNRIFWFTTASALAAAWLLRSHVPEWNAALGRLDGIVTLGADKGLPTTGGYLLPALAVGIAARVFRLHGRVSEWLGISERFDIHVIMGEFAEQLGIDLAPVGEERMRNARGGFMRKAFYPFVSSSKPQIDPHLVHQALDAWSWQWVTVESLVVFAVTGCWLLGAGEYRAGLGTLGGALGFALVGLPALRGQCRRYAVAQVRAILDDPARERCAGGAGRNDWRKN